ncbi:flavin reductase family protein [Sulfurovum sp. ST-21]|uniref:Flavin reductase family protein n=1 Tax=Sulfurovum indicum TaxID=2779528 RepID=A0A7M1S2M6_9BACT|nr:flavin reductase family protein [Sulfurovum indicum]QOR61695.1 flavin reductase family protein [Sulfurovum indicum]
MLFDLSNDKSVNETYKLMAQTIIPRPIAWVVTEDEGVVNIAPFSYFIGLSSDPASVLISVGHKSDGTPKDTLLNIRKHQKCTICMVEEKDLEKMHLSSKSLEHDESEAAFFDIETVYMKEEFPPVIASTPVSYFCEFNQEIDLGGGTTIPLVLSVKEIYVKDEVITDKEKLLISFAPVARIGKSYAFLGEEIVPPVIP